MGSKSQLPWGHKQLHVEHEGEPKIKGHRGSLKKNKVCKKTKGPHVEYVLECYYPLSSYATWKCFCGKHMRGVWLCKGCKKECTWQELMVPSDRYPGASEIVDKCKDCRALDKKPVV